MDVTYLRSSHAAKSIHVLVCLMLLMQHCNATQFIVGGAKGWSVPGVTNSSSLNQWAESRRFQIGDSLLFAYDPSHDSVLEVTKEDYANCTSTTPVATYTDGHSVYSFNHSGPHYFISGNKDHCLKNEKLVIIVLADRNKNTNDTTTGYSPSPAPTSASPSPSPSPSLAPAPTSEQSIPPEPVPPPSSAAPTGEQPTAVESVPSPSPVNHPRNAAMSVVCLRISGLVGAFFASALFT